MRISCDERRLVSAAPGRAGRAAAALSRGFRLPHAWPGPSSRPPPPQPPRRPDTGLLRTGVPVGGPPGPSGARRLHPESPPAAAASRTPGRRRSARPAWVYRGRLPVPPARAPGGHRTRAQRGPPGLLGSTAPAQLASGARLRPGERCLRELTSPRRPRAGGGNGLGPRGLHKRRRLGSQLRQRPCCQWRNSSGHVGGARPASRFLLPTMPRPGAARARPLRRSIHAGRELRRQQGALVRLQNRAKNVA